MVFENGTIKYRVCCWYFFPVGFSSTSIQKNSANVGERTVGYSIVRSSPEGLIQSRP